MMKKIVWNAQGLLLLAFIETTPDVLLTKESLPDLMEEIPVEYLRLACVTQSCEAVLRNSGENTSGSVV